MPFNLRVGRVTPEGHHCGLRMALQRFSAMFTDFVAIRSAGDHDR